nr:nucleolar protein 8 [Crassostrea gigas]
MKRLFVGGLFPGVTEDDIIERFKRFGEITGVEIKKKKTTDTASLGNTFAYIDLNITDENLSKCFSLYNKTKWKGLSLRIQLAKEDFLKRLIKERENGFAVKPKIKKPKGKHQEPLKNPKIQDFVMQGAVPGTLIEGGKDWVVGKYGRVLPIVHIPSKHGKKIMTVDPSKFCHNLKRMKDDREDSSNIDALTWHLREENPVHIKNKKPYKKDPDFAKKKCSIIKRKKVKSSSNVYKDDNCVNFDSDEVSSVGGYTSSDEDSVSSADTDIIIAKQSQRNHLRSCGFQEPNLSSDNQGLNVSQTVDSNSDSGDSSTSTELLASKNGPNLDNYSMHWEDNSTDDETKSDFENTSLKEMTTIGNEELSAFRSESNKTISNIALPPFKGTSSLYGSRDSKVQERSTEDRASFGDLPSTTTVTVVSSQTASNRMEPSSSTTELHKQGDKGDICGLISMGKSLKVLKNDRVTDSIEKERQKSRESELKRLESMMERSKETERKKKAIHQALALDNAGEKPNKKIIFDSESSDVSEDHEEDEIQLGHDNCNERQQKKPALFDSSSENEDDEEIDEERFRIRPEYEGKAGKQLMKLQARFQNDERFRMDEKFIDEPDSSEMDSEEEEKHGNNSQKETSDEKSRAYKILGEVLGTTTVAKVERKKAMFRDVSAIHFDPTKEDHKQFEMEPHKKKEKVVKTNKDIMDSSDDEETQNAEKQNEELPEVTKERFYEVMSDSFKDAFSDKGPDLASKSFSLMSTFEGKEDSDTNDQDMFDSKEVPDYKKLEQTLWNPDGADRNDRIMSSDQEDGELYNPVRLCTSNQTFFFSSENDERVKEGISAFYRKEDFDEIRKEWLQNRQSLVNAYRTKHKSLSRRKKMEEKRKRRK